MNFENEHNSNVKRTSGHNKNIDELDLPFSDTLKDADMETLRSEDEEIAVESGIRAKDPNMIIVRGTIPLSTNIQSTNYPEIEKPAIENVKPKGFEIKTVPEWQMRVRGTVITQKIKSSPHQVQAPSIKNDDEQKAA